jgi:hypothetical protein
VGGHYAETATQVALVAVVVAAVGMTIAVLTGNWLLLYLGAFMWPLGALLLLSRMTAALWHRREDQA